MSSAIDKPLSAIIEERRSSAQTERRQKKDAKPKSDLEKAADEALGGAKPSRQERTRQDRDRRQRGRNQDKIQNRREPRRADDRSFDRGRGGVRGRGGRRDRQDHRGGNDSYRRGSPSRNFEVVYNSSGLEARGSDRFSDIVGKVETIGRDGGAALPASGAAAITLGTSIMVTNLLPDVTAEDLVAVFSAIGAVRSAVVHTDAGGKSKRTADVVFRRKADAEEAIAQFDGREVDGQTIRCFMVGSAVDHVKTDLLRSSNATVVNRAVGLRTSPGAGSEAAAWFDGGDTRDDGRVTLEGGGRRVVPGVRGGIDYGAGRRGPDFGSSRGGRGGGAPPPRGYRDDDARAREVFLGGDSDSGSRRGRGRGQDRERGRGRDWDADGGGDGRRRGGRGRRGEDGNGNGGGLHDDRAGEVQQAEVPKGPVGRKGRKGKGSGEERESKPAPSLEELDQMMEAYRAKRGGGGNGAAASSDGEHQGDSKESAGEETA